MKMANLPHGADFIEHKCNQNTGTLFGLYRYTGEKNRKKERKKRKKEHTY